MKRGRGTSGMFKAFNYVQAWFICARTMVCSDHRDKQTEFGYRKVIRSTEQEPSIYNIDRVPYFYPLLKAYFSYYHANMGPPVKGPVLAPQLSTPGQPSIYAIAIDFARTCTYMDPLSPPPVKKDNEIAFSLIFFKFYKCLLTLLHCSLR